MPSCVASGCSARAGKGVKMHCFPRDPDRRRLWEAAVGRKNWKSSEYSTLCASHFDETQYESQRVDNLRRLKPFAVPTLFGPDAKRGTLDPPPSAIQRVQDVIIHPLYPSPREKVEQDHSYCILNEPGTDPISDSQTQSEGEDAMDDEDFKDKEKQSGTEEGTEIEDQTRTKKQIRTHEQILIGPFSEDSSVIVATTKCRCAALRRKIIELQKKLAKERREKQKLLHQRANFQVNVAKVFNKEQLTKLGSKSTRGSRWSEETMKKAFEIRLACGADGYQFLLAQNMPLPSMRTLRRELMKQQQLEYADDIPSGDVHEDSEPERRTVRVELDQHSAEFTSSGECLTSKNVQENSERGETTFKVEPAQYTAEVPSS